jgi:protein-S-isoprenylcysteine O-methyltransferase Ste14
MKTLRVNAFTHHRLPGRHPHTPTADLLPSLGRRGGGWVSLQLLLLATAVTAGLLGTPWPPTPRPWLAASGGAALLAGLGLLLGGGAGLGRQLTPFPKPVPGSSLRRDGVYALVRHPMYGGALLAILGWALLSSPLALLPWGAAAAFLEAKSRREEAWLTETHPNYPTYRQQVPRRFLPWTW